MENVIYCIANSKTQAETIVSNLKNAGFSSNDISVLLPDTSGTRDFAHERRRFARSREPTTHFRSRRHRRGVSSCAR